MLCRKRYDSGFRLEAFGLGFRVLATRADKFVDVLQLAAETAACEAQAE